MLAYAASRPIPVDRRPHPNALLTIIALHVGVAAVVMSAKMDIPGIIKGQRTEIFWVTPPKPPQPFPQPRARPTPQPDPNRTVDRVDPFVPTPPRPTDGIDTGPAPHLGDDLVLGSGAGVNVVIPPPVHDIVRLAPKLLTSGEELKPPYPAAKLLTEEEASLRLRLTIDASGRVVGVDPVGRADPVFFAAARRWLLSHWRYRPATEDGRGVASTEVITLHFQLDG
jgi:protein TonB